jgi:cell division septal protein FtsQ
MANGGGSGRPRFRLVPTVLLTLAILLVPTALYAWGRSSSSFTIDNVVVTGAHLVKQQRLQRLLRQEYVGRNLFTVTTDDVRGTLKPLTYVARATIDRDFPTTLRVRIEEHQPVAYVLSADRWYVVAADAHVITMLAPGSEATATAAGVGSAAAEASGSSGGASEGSAAAAADQADAGGEHLAVLKAGPPGAEARLPRLAAAGKVEAGRGLDDPEARLAVNVVAGLTEPLRERLAVVVVHGGRVTLHFSDGLLVKWGERDRGAAKTLALRAVLVDYDKRDVDPTLIDVSTPERTLGRPVLK